MNRNAARVPPVPAGTTGDDLVAAINDRIRRLGMLTSSVTTTTAKATGSTGSQVLIAVPGTLGVDSTAAPIFSFPATVQPTALVALLDIAPTGGPVQVQISAGTTPISAVTIPEGATQASGSAPVAIPANAIVTVAITGVGLTFGGSGLTLMLRF